jgi:hypothetical protein
MGFLLQHFVRNEQNLECAVPSWGETLDALTALKGRRIPVELIAITFFLLQGCSIAKAFWC